MTIAELIERLEDYRDALGGEAEVRLMTQQNWPFDNEIRGVASLSEVHGQDPEDFDAEGDAEHVVYIIEGRQLGYGTATAWEVAH
jgi:hypothetical protein